MLEFVFYVCVFWDVVFFLMCLAIIGADSPGYLLHPLFWGVTVFCFGYCVWYLFYYYESFILG